MNRRIFLLFVLSIIFVIAPIDAVITRTYSFQFKIPDIKTMRIVRPNYASTTLNLELRALQAGASVDLSGTAVDNSTWLQVTSIAPLNENRRVMVQVTNGTTIPLGTLLKLTAANCTTGDGDRGSAYSNILLSSSTAYPLIDGIGSCYTGTSIVLNSTSGYNLTFTWMPDPANIDKLVAFSSYQIYVTYTLMSY